MAKYTTKIGDIFEVVINEKEKRFFQLIAFDQTQLNSDVIRAFKKKYPIQAVPNSLDTISDEVDFYAHCVVKFGLRMNLWRKISNSNEVGNIENILFRGSKDSGVKPGEQVKISNSWYIWRINDPKFTLIGVLPDEYKKAELGLIVNPHDVVERLKTGNYSFYYPSF